MVADGGRRNVLRCIIAALFLLAEFGLPPVDENCCALAGTALLTPPLLMLF